MGQDIYRDSALRYCGYANEVGEAFRPLVPSAVVHASYAVAIAYVLADCVDKTHKEYKAPRLGGSRVGKAAIKAGDVFIWQMLASVVVPGLIINRVTWGAGKLCKAIKVNGMPRRWGPTLTGLVCIPFIIAPIDKAIDHLMDATYRKIV